MSREYNTIKKVRTIIKIQQSVRKIIKMLTDLLVTLHRHRMNGQHLSEGTKLKK